MSELHTSYLGLALRSPLVASSSPLTHHVEGIAALVDAGAGAVVLPSLFEEQVEHEASELERLYTTYANSTIEADSFFPEIPDYESVVDVAVSLVERAKQRVDVPVIASVNGTHPGGWIRYARLLEEAGADAIEINLYTVAADSSRSSATIEREQIDLVESLVRELGVPVAVKLSPFYTGLGAFLADLEAVGASGVSLFNRFYQPDLDMETFGVSSTLTLSTSIELRVPLRWIALVRDERSLSLAATTGVHTGLDIAKVILAGADVAMTASAVLRHGPRHIATMLDELRRWMADHDYESVAQMRGALRRGACDDPEAYERANYLGSLTCFTSDYLASR